MDESLRRLVRELRQETCPQAVLDEVARRRSTAARSSNPFRYGLVGVGAVLVLLCAVAVWQRPAGGDARGRTERAGRANPGGAQIAGEAEGALEYIGSILRDAGTHSGRVILKGAVPPLQNSLQKAKNKITNHI